MPNSATPTTPKRWPNCHHPRSVSFVLGQEPSSRIKTDCWPQNLSSPTSLPSPSSQFTQTLTRISWHVRRPQLAFDPLPSPP